VSNETPNKQSSLMPVRSQRRAKREALEPLGERSAEGLTMPVQFLKGVGPARAEVFARLGVRTIADLL